MPRPLRRPRTTATNEAHALSISDINPVSEIDLPYINAPQTSGPEDVPCRAEYISAPFRTTREGRDDGSRRDSDVDPLFPSSSRTSIIVHDMLVANSRGEHYNLPRGLDEQTMNQIFDALYVTNSSFQRKIDTLCRDRNLDTGPFRDYFYAQYRNGSTNPMRDIDELMIEYNERVGQQRQGAVLGTSTESYRRYMNNLMSGGVTIPAGDTRRPDQILEGIPMPSLDQVFESGLEEAENPAFHRPRRRRSLDAPSTSVTLPDWESQNAYDSAYTAFQNMSHKINWIFSRQEREGVNRRNIPPFSPDDFFAKIATQDSPHPLNTETSTFYDWKLGGTNFILRLEYFTEEDRQFLRCHYLYTPYDRVLLCSDRMWDGSKFREVHHVWAKSPIQAEEDRERQQRRAERRSGIASDFIGTMSSNFLTVASDQDEDIEEDEDLEAISEEEDGDDNWPIITGESF